MYIFHASNKYLYRMNNHNMPSLIKLPTALAKMIIEAGLLPNDDFAHGNQSDPEITLSDIHQEISRQDKTLVALTQQWWTQYGTPTESNPLLYDIRDATHYHVYHEYTMDEGAFVGEVVITDSNHLMIPVQQ